MTTTATNQNTDDRRLPASSVWTRYGVCDRTLDRWIAKEALGFPKPIVINRRRYFNEQELLDWERAQASKARAA